MYRRSNVVVGGVFVILGVLFLLRTLNIFYFSFNIGHIIAEFWPTLFLIIPSIFMHSAYFSGTNKDAGILVPAGILLTTGLTCQLSSTFHIWGLMWPGFIMAVAVGLFELYLFGTREKGLLIPVTILGGLSLIFFASFSFRVILGFHTRQFITPAVLILLGIAIIAKNGMPGKKY